MPQSRSTSKKRKSRQILGQSRVTLCVFMCMLLSFNPVSVFLSSVPSTTLVHSDYRMGLKEATKNIHHRTLRSSSNEPSFGDFSNGFEEETEEKSWWLASHLRQAFVWAINSFIVIFVLVRLFIYGEPTAWPQFLIAKKQALIAIHLGNYREAQRQLSDSLQVILIR